MKSLCTKGILFFSLALLVVVFAACTQSKPAVPTPTLVPLASDTTAAPSGQSTQAPADQATQAPSGQGTPVAPPDATLVVPNPNAVTTVPGGGDQTPALQPLDQTPGAPGQVTPIIVEPTLLPTPTTAGDNGQSGQPTAEPGTGAENPTPAASTNTGGSCTNPYTVQPGEWFYAIARKCNVSAADLLSANPGMNPNVLHPGQTLNLPAGGGSAPDNSNPPPSDQSTPAPSDNGGGSTGGTGACSNPYTVQRGDTLYSIATRCGSTVAAIQQANGIPAPEYIFPGQQLQIP